MVETYDRCYDLLSEPKEEGYLQMLGHMSKWSDITVTIDKNGKLLHIDKDKKEITIPCTIDSASRSGSAKFPHPLQDELTYLIQDLEKFELYMKQLEAFKGDNVKLNAVYKYLEGKSLIEDIEAYGIKLKEEEQTDKKTKEKIKVKKYKEFINFRVEIDDELTPELWQDKKISELWIAHYLKDPKLQLVDICYITGNLSKLAIKHPKGTYKKTNSAVLVSTEVKEIKEKDGRKTYKIASVRNNNAVSLETSHKGHAMLRYLIATQGLTCDNQAIVAWAIDNNPRTVPLLEDSQKYYLDIFDSEESNISSDKKIKAEGLLGINYAKNVRNALLGFGNPEKFKRHKNKVAIIAVDAATTGRMSVTFYQEFQEDEYLERIANWHEKCCWYTWGDNISSPSADNIIKAVFGGVKGKSFDKVKKQALQRLLHNIFCNEPLSRGYIISATRCVSSPFSYSDDKTNKWEVKRWRKMLNVTCALVRLYYLNKGEEFLLELETKRTDRDYLYGRLLAIADRIEVHARYVQDKDNKDRSPTNAIRYMTAFASKPFRTWETIYRQLNPYIMRLGGAFWYQQQIDEIMSLFLSGEYEDNSPLNGKYLMGYSLQRRELNKKNNIETGEDINDESNQED